MTIEGLMKRYKTICVILKKIPESNCKLCRFQTTDFNHNFYCRIFEIILKEDSKNDRFIKPCKKCKNCKVKEGKNVT